MYSLRLFKKVSAHEFGHALGVADAIGWGYPERDNRPAEYYSRHGVVSSRMANHMVPKRKLDLDLVLRAHRDNKWQEFPNEFNDGMNEDLLKVWKVKPAPWADNSPYEKI